MSSGRTSSSSARRAAACRWRTSTPSTPRSSARRSWSRKSAPARGKSSRSLACPMPVGQSRCCARRPTSSCSTSRRDRCMTPSACSAASSKSASSRREEVHPRCSWPTSLASGLRVSRAWCSTACASLRRRWRWCHTRSLRTPASTPSRSSPSCATGTTRASRRSASTCARAVLQTFMRRTSWCRCLCTRRRSRLRPSVCA
mmetsp:Transcript_63043/g.140419  ORF Transcript_63043/g.140419 Transcript_63043/m.140419 type:complete len:201 (+) Transcript_63043:968-1570(+)